MSLGLVWRSVILGLALVGVGGSACSLGGSDGEPAGKEGASDAPSSALTGAVQSAWVGQVSHDLPGFKAFLGSAPGNGWQLLYQHSYRDAAAAFESGQGADSAIGAARAHLALARLFAEGAEVSHAVDRSMAALLTENAGRVEIVSADRLIQASHLLHGGGAEAATQALSLVDGVLAATPGDPRMISLAKAMKVGALLKTGDAAQAKTLAASLTQPDAKALAAALTACFGEGPVPPPGPEGLGTYGKRARLFTLVEAGELDEAQSLAEGLVNRTPDLKVQVKGKEGPVDRSYYDPIGLLALARLHARLALKDLDAAGATGGIPDAFRAQARAFLGGDTSVDPASFPPEGDAAQWRAALYFGPHATPADFKAAAARLGGKAGATGGLSGAFEAELGPIAAEGDQGQAVRATQDLARRVETLLSESLSAGAADEEGVATAKTLHLPRALVASLVRARAEGFIDAGRKLSGLALLEYTFEKEQSSRVTHINAPHLFMATARTYGRAERHREGLNYLYRLLEPFPELWPVYEAMSNLSVLGTLDQPGVNAQ